MSVLAIDPGTTESAFAWWNGSEIVEHAKIANRELLKYIERMRVRVPLAVEMIASYGMPVGAEVFETCVWIGRYLQAWGGTICDAQFSYVYRRDVKLHLCGTSRAKDANVRQALIDRFGKPGTKAAPGITYGLKGDEWAAFAVAVTWHDKQRKAVAA